MNALQEALEAEEQTLATQLTYVRRTLEHLRLCRRELAIGKSVKGQAA